MADNVIIVQQTNRDGTKLLAPKVPEAAVYDAEGKLLSVKMADISAKIEDVANEKGNSISITKWHTSTTTPMTLAANEVGYNAVTNKLYIGKYNGTSFADLEELEMKATVLYYYKGNSYEYRASKLQYANGTVQGATVGNTNPFSTSTSYNKGELVEKDGTIYEALENVAAGAWDETKFSEYILKDNIKAQIGNLETLQTEAKNTLVAAINEVKQQGGGGGSKPAGGWTKSDLSTDVQSSLTKADAVQDTLNQLIEGGVAESPEATVAQVLLNKTAIEEHENEIAEVEEQAKYVSKIVERTYEQMAAVNGYYNYTMDSINRN